jgi:hypothetical protein
LAVKLLSLLKILRTHLAARHVPEEHDALVKYAQKQSPFNNMTIAYKKEHVLNVGGYQHHLWMEDYNLFLRLIAANYKLHNLNEVLVYARVDNGMHGRRKGLAYIKSEFQLMKTKTNLQITKSITGIYYLPPTFICTVVTIKNVSQYLQCFSTKKGCKVMYNA